MSSKIKYQKNYTEFNETYQLVLPLSLEGFVPDDDSVRLLSHELEELDYTLLYKAYSSKERNPAVDPKTMFKILTYAYSQNIYSSRKIEQACRRDINFMWLLAGQKAPDHSTIARFRTGFLAEACEDLFYQMVRRLKDAEELSMETVFIDGTKLEACANKYTFVWKKSVGKWEEKMFHKIQEAVRLLNHDYMQSFTVNTESRAQDLQKISGYLEEKCQQDGTEFVYGRGRRKSKNQKYLELFQRFRERQVTYDWHTASFQGRNNYCKTDPDATFMHMKDDHMRNAQLKPGYNIQIGVDSEYIVSADVFQDRNDVWTLVPFLKMMDEKLGFRYPSVTADSGYESEEGYTYLRSLCHLRESLNLRYHVVMFIEKQEKCETVLSWGQIEQILEVNLNNGKINGSDSDKAVLTNVEFLYYPVFQEDENRLALVPVWHIYTPLSVWLENEELSEAFTTNGAASSICVNAVSGEIFFFDTLYG